MGINNRERVDKALELLRQGLGPYIEREFPSEKVGTLSPETRRRLPNDPNIVDKPVGEWDIAALLRLMTVIWREVFHATLGHKVRSWVSELIAWRNDWAHQKPISDDDTYRVLDSASRLLTAVSAKPQADEIDGMRKELRRLIADVQPHRGKGQKDDSPDAEDGDIELHRRRGRETLDWPSNHRDWDIEKRKIYQDYTDLIGEVVEGEIYQIRRHEVLVLHGKNESRHVTTVERELGITPADHVLHGKHETGRYVGLVLPRSEQLPQDWYREGNTLRAVVKGVQRDIDNNPQVIISRRDPAFMERLFELEVPLIYSGTVQVKRIAWEPGEGAIIAVWSNSSPYINPVEACMEKDERTDDGGYVLNRMGWISFELYENMQLIEYSSDPYRLIERVFSSAKPIIINIPGEWDPPRVEAVVKAEELSQVIGRNGINIRLASRLSGCQIDVRVS